LRGGAGSAPSRPREIVLWLGRADSRGDCRRSRLCGTIAYTTYGAYAEESEFSPREVEQRFGKMFKRAARMGQLAGVRW